jgi:lipoic acid synthetase
MVTPGKPASPLDSLEPDNVAFALSQMDLNYVVLTSVDRDDIPDGGASHFARTIRKIRESSPGMMVEVLVPDFQNDVDAIRTVVEARPDVIAHNIETTLSLSDRVRDPRASYWQSLSVLRTVKKLDRRMFTKSSIMVGLGESVEEMGLAMSHLRGAGVDFLTVGQYLRPSKRHLPVKEYVTPERYVASGPLVRSSYRAGEFFVRSIVLKDKTISEVQR